MYPTAPIRLSECPFPLRIELTRYQFSKLVLHPNLSFRTLPATRSPYGSNAFGTQGNFSTQFFIFIIRIITDFVYTHDK